MQFPNLFFIENSQKVFKTTELMIQQAVAGGSTAFIVETNLSNDLRWKHSLQMNNEKPGTFNIDRLNLSLGHLEIFEMIRQIVIRASNTGNSVLFIDNFTEMSKIPGVGDLVSQLVANGRKDGIKTILVADNALSSSTFGTKIMANSIMMQEGVESWPGISN